MNSAKHHEIACNIERSLAKCGPEDVEMRIEAAMLAATHWLNAALHDIGANPPDKDVMHTYMLTINDFRRLSLPDPRLLAMLAEIEDIRPLYVRGDAPGGREAADRACGLLDRIREMALRASAAR